MLRWTIFVVYDIPDVNNENDYDYTDISDYDKLRL